MVVRSVPVWLAVGLVGTAASVSLADAFAARGTIEEVTVYRGQALVTRVVGVDQPAGIAEIVVTDLPDRIIPESLFAESGGGLEVRSVRFRTRPVLEDVNEEVRRLDEQITALRDKLEATRRYEQVLGEHKAYLAKLEQFVAPAANAELSRGVLNADTLASLTQLLLTQRREAAEQELRLAAERRDLEKQIDLAQRQRATIASGSARTVREALVLAEVREPRGATLRVRYLVDQAGWTPSYTARSDGGGAGVRLEYYASIQQMTGEDWTGVSMTLSTATPSLAARAPELSPLTVSLVGPGMSQQAVEPQALDYGEAKMANMRQRRQVEHQRGQGAAEAGARFDRDLNEIASADLMLDLTARERIRRGGPGSTSGTTAEPDGLSVTYTLTGPTSLPSRAERQQVQIASLSLPAEFYKVATPALTTSVYDEALARNTSDMVLLAGPVGAYVEGRFVGSGELPTVAVGESFVLGFGHDPSLRARRELVERLESVQGGNRIVDLTYRLAIDNFGPGEARVRLLDRIPRTREQEIKLTLVNPSVQPSTEPGAAERRKEGIIRWDVVAGAQAFGEKAAAVEYTIRLEHDKQMVIAGMGAGR